MAEQRIDENPTTQTAASEGEAIQEAAVAAKPAAEKNEKIRGVGKVFYIAPKKRGQALKISIVSLLALLLFSFVINSYVELNEVYSQISTANSQLNEYRSENVRMQTELEGQASIRNIKEYAEKRLGLQKIDQSQIQYIQIRTEDEVIVEEPEQNIFIRIKRWFYDTIEYLRG